MIDPPPETHRLSPDHLPTPFSADQIRLAAAPGTRVAFRLEQVGESVHVDRWEFLDGDDVGGERRRWAETPDGTVIEGPDVTYSMWSALQQHASYPGDRTSLDSATVTIAPGAFECWRYTVTDPDSATVTRAWFAPDLPGPPIVLETRVENAVVFRMELVEISRPT